VQRRSKRSDISPTSNEIAKEIFKPQISQITRIFLSPEVLDRVDS
jgi:hypothetical protein